MSPRQGRLGRWVVATLVAALPSLASGGEAPAAELARALEGVESGRAEASADLRRLVAELETGAARQQRQFGSAAARRLPPTSARRLQDARAAYESGQGRLLALLREIVRGLDGAKVDRAVLREARELASRLVEAPRREPISSGDLKVRATGLQPPPLGTSEGTTTVAAEGPIGPVPDVLKRAAAELAGPVEVYEWVRNLMRPELYHGVMKGAEDAYREGGGNDADTSAVLVAMLRAKGIPARFVRGTAEVAASVLQAVVGTANPEQAVRALERAAIPHEVVRAAGGVTSVRLERVWVEAYVPYANYRGALVDLQGKAWIPLDAAFKRLSPPQLLDPVRDLGLDARALVDEYVAGPRTATPREFLRDDVRARLASRQPELTYERFVNHRDPLAENLGVLPSTLPYKTVGAREVVYELPEALRHRLRFLAERDGSTLLDASAPVSDVIGRRLTLSYVPFAPEDEEVVRQYGGLLKTPPYLVQVRPVIKSGGIELAAGRSPIGLGVTFTFTMAFTTPGGQETITNRAVAGNLTAIGLGGAGATRDDEVAGKAAQVLSAIAQSYLERWNASDDELSGVFKVVPVRPTVSACLVLSEVDVDLAGGDPLYPVSYQWKGIAVDADLRASAPVGISDRAAEKAFTLISALEGSVLEHQVLEDVVQVASVSTAKSLGLAAAQGVPVHDLTSANVDAVLPFLPLDDGVKAEIRDATARGFLARVPARQVSLLSWTGVGYLLIDEETGEAAYQLQGGHSGGVTAPSVFSIPAAIRDPLLAGGEDVAMAPEDATVARVQKFSATDFQEGTVARPLARNLKVLVTDAEGFAVPRARVTFTVIGGGGSLLDPVLGGLGESEVVVRANERGEAAVTLVLGRKTDLIPRFVDLGDEYPIQVGLNLVSARSGAAGLAEPFTAVAYPDYRREGDGIRFDVSWKGQDGSCTACGWPNLRAAALMALAITDPYGNPLSNVPIRFAYKPDPVPVDAPPGWVRMRPGTMTPGRVLKPADYLACATRTATVSWGECAGEADAVAVRSSAVGAFAYAVLGDSLHSYYNFVVSTPTGPPLTTIGYPTNGFLCRGAEPGGCDNTPAEPMVFVGTRDRVVNRLGNMVEAAPPGGEAEVVLWVDQLTEDAEVYRDGAGYAVRGRNTWRRERLLDSTFRLQPTTSGTTSSPSAAPSGVGLYQGLMQTAPAPQLNTVRYGAVHRPWVVPYVRLGQAYLPPRIDPASVVTNPDGTLGVRRVKDPARTATSTGEFSVWGVKPEILAVDPSPVVLDAGGAVERPARVEHRISPETFRQLLAPIDVVFEVRRDGSNILSAIGADGAFEVPRGLAIPAGSPTAHLSVLGVTASAQAPIESAPFALPTCPLVDLLTPIVVVPLTLDPVNQTTCGKEGEVRFFLCRDARVTLLVDGKVVTSAIDEGPTPVTIRDLVLVAGEHVARVPSGMLGLSATATAPLSLRAVDVRDPTLEATAEGTVINAVRNRSVLPVGHTFVKGVDLLDGHLVKQATDLGVTGRHLGLEMTRTYSSAGRSPKGALGAGWSWNWEVALTPLSECGLVTVTTPDGSSQVFRTTDGGVTFRPQKGYHTRLSKLGDGSYDFVDKAGTRYHFRPPADPLRPDVDARRIEYVEEPHRDRLVPTYDTAGRVVRVAEIQSDAGEVRRLELTYGKAGGFDRIVRAVVSDLGLEATFGYDEFGNLVEATRAGVNLAGQPEAEPRRERYEYSRTEVRDRHQMLAAIDANGNRTEYVYHRAGDVFPGGDAVAVDQKVEFVSQVLEFPGPSGASAVFRTEFRYDYGQASSLRYSTTVRDPRQNETVYVMNGNGSPLEIREPLDRTTSMQWAADDIVKTKETDPLGRVTEYAYDDRGNLASERILTADLGVVETRYEYEPRFNKLTLKVDAEGRRTEYEIDPLAGDLVSMVDAVGNRTVYRFDAQGRLTAVVDPRSHVTTHAEHDSFGNARAVTDALGNRTDREYDLRGRLVRRTDTFGRETRTVYDGRDQPVEVRRVAGGDSDDEVTATSYFPGGQPRVVTNAGGAVTTFTLDGLNRVVSTRVETEGETLVASMQYDGNGNRVGEIDRRGVRRRLDYDALNRLVRVSIESGLAGEGPTGVVSEIGYDLVGNKVAETNLARLTTGYVYDGLYRVRKRVLPEGEPRYSETSLYDRVGNRTSFKDANGNETKYAYDGLDRVVRTENALGQVSTVTYADPEGSRVDKAEEHDQTRGRRTVYAYDVLDRETRREVRLEGAGGSGEVYATRTSYDDSAHATTVTDPRGTPVLTRFDGLDRAVERVVDAGGLALSTRAAYDGLGNRKLVVDPEGHPTQYEHDGLGRLLRVTDALRRASRMTYDGEGLKTSETDRRGVRRGFTYDNVGRPRVTTVAPSLSGVPWRQETRYEDVARRRREIDARGKETVFALDGLERVAKVTDPLGFSMSTRYDGVNKRAETSKRGNKTSFDYDALNRLVRVTDPAPFEGQTAVTAYLDDANQRIETDRRGIVRVTQMDPLGRVRSVTRAGVLLERNDYDAVGNRVLTRDGEDKQTRFEYDAADRLAVRTDGFGSPAAAAATFRYDRDGNLTEERDARAASLGEPFSAQNAYDAVHRLRSVTDGAMDVTRYDYDEEGNRTVVQEPEGQETSFTYDELGKLLSVVQPGGRATRHAYDPARNRIRQTDANGHVVEFAYDDLNRVASMTQDPGGLGLVTAYRYDEDGDRIGVTDPKAQSTRVAYDELGRVKSKSFAFAPGDSLRPWRYTSAVAYAYDANGNVVSSDDFVVSGPDPPVTLSTFRVWDDLDRLTSETAALPNGGARTVSYTYFANGARKTVTDPPGGATAYTYDGQNRLASATSAGGTTSYAYFEDDLLRSVSYPNGVVASHGYDLADRLVSLENARGAASLSRYAYAYDRNGNRLSQVEANGGPPETTTYTYDALDRLSTIRYPADALFPSGRAVEYRYDDVGNRTSEIVRGGAGALLANKQGIFDNVNRLTSLRDVVDPVGTASLEWDANGNQVSKSVGGVTTSFAYDLRDRMVETSSGASVLARFQYDGDGRRTGKIGADGSIQYVYDQTSVLAEYDEGGVLAARYDYGSDRLIALSRAVEGRRWYSLDAMRSVVNLTDDSGSLVASYHLDAWGNFRFPAELSASRNRFAFTGYEWDPELGLYNAKARYFDPQIGRFLSQDSFLGQIDDPPSLHRYFYGNDNPARFIDTTGHAGQEAQRIQYEGFNVTPQGYTESLKFGENVTVTASPDRASSVPQEVGRLVAPLNRAADVGFRAGGVAIQATAAVALAAAPDPTGATKLGAAYLGLRAADEGQALIRELRSGQPTMSEAQKGLGIAIQHATGADPDTADFYGGMALTGLDVATGAAIAKGAASTVEEGRAAGRSKIAPAAGKSEPSAPVGQHGVNLLDPVPLPESGESYIYSDPAKYAHNRSKALQESLSPTTRGRVTMSASVAEDPATGERVVLIGTSERRGYIRPGVRQALKPSEVVVPGTGHAEADISAYAKDKGYKTFTGAGRPHCPPCVDAIEDAGGAAVSPRRPVKTAPLPRKDMDSND